METTLLTPDDIRRIIEQFTVRDLITICATAHVLIRERGCDLAATGGPRRFNVYKGKQDRLGYLEVLPDYTTAWYPMPTQPIQFDLPLDNQEV